MDGWVCTGLAGGWVGSRRAGVWGFGGRVHVWQTFEANMETTN